MYHLKMSGKTPLRQSEMGTASGAAVITPQPEQVKPLGTAPDFPAQIAALESRVASLEAAAKADGASALATLQGWWEHLSRSFPHLPTPPKAG